MDKLVQLLGAVMLGFGLVIFAIFGASAIGAFPFKWCWNYIVPSLFGLRQIGALEAFCLIWVSSALFKSFSNSSSKNNS